MNLSSVNLNVSVQISANAVITKYLDNRQLIVLRAVTRCHITEKSMATKKKTGPDLFYFLAGLSHCATLLSENEIDAERSRSRKLSHSHQFLYFGWCHMWKHFCRTDSKRDELNAEGLHMRTQEWNAMKTTHI